MPGIFIDANILFRMFAITLSRLERFESSGSSGSKPLDYAIRILIKLRDGAGTYFTSELALLEACGVASNETSSDKAYQLLKSALEQDGLGVLEVQPLAWPLAFSFTLYDGVGARDALHLAVALLGQVNKITTSDSHFADGIERMRVEIKDSGRINIPPIIQSMYGISGEERGMLEQNITRVLSSLDVERAPA